MVFPPDTFNTVLSSPQAAAAVAAMLYVDAVVPDSGPTLEETYWARPTTCLWLSDEAYSRTNDDDRLAWREAASKRRATVVALLKDWGHPLNAWYADNSRETLRDETLPGWLGFGALRDRPGVKTTSSYGRWALTESFADLFDPDLDGKALTEAVEAWISSHMTPGDRYRIRRAREMGRRDVSVIVNLPDGSTRNLEPGEASMILKGVVEDWAPRRLAEPEVLTISEPGNKILLADGATLAEIGLLINVSTLLPDALLVDLGAEPRPKFWLVEAVSSDGPIDEDRKAALLRWAEDQRIPPGDCEFLTAFASRHHPSARKRLKDLAAGTFAWYADEPGRELAWYEIS